ncbi:MAG: nucleotidyl transferase AbiEii/AbiGii toxin family protein [Kiritimatiellae bacterium]|nr:nucleotidyl transferase AbiEii/AbiGii toxin family protein [Kiritimatiellia bacterium]
MPLTRFQKDICHLIAANRKEQSESYVAGGSALNEIIGAPRFSHDIDLFHDTQEALLKTWDADRSLLTFNGYKIDIIRDHPSFIEVMVSMGDDHVLLQWVRDSAYRFFPLVESVDFGLTLHPYDLATNKVLAMVGRVEVRDWIDVVECHTKIQQLGYLLWGACGKDPGFGPEMILNQAKRSARYTDVEVSDLSFSGKRPTAKELSVVWHRMTKEAELILRELPAMEVGKCVLDVDGTLFQGNVEELKEALSSNHVRFHSGSIRGVYPVPV